MLNTIEDILDQSRMNFGKFKLALGWFSMEELVDDTLDMVEFLAVDRGL
jgi:signal transduction histidine kinase